MLHGVRMVSVGLEKVEHRLSEDLERDTHMAVIVERVEHFHAQVAAIRVAGVEFPGGEMKKRFSNSRPLCA